MLKVNPALKCKFNSFQPAWDPKKDPVNDGWSFCKRLNKTCKGLPCEHYVNKYKEWEEQRENTIQISERCD